MGVLVKELDKHSRFLYQQSYTHYYVSFTKHCCVCAKGFQFIFIVCIKLLKFHDYYNRCGNFCECCIQCSWLYIHMWLLVQQAQFVFFSSENVYSKDAPFALSSLLLVLNMYSCHSM